MKNLEQTIETSFLGKIKNGFSRIKHSVAGRIAVYSLAGILSAGLGCGWDPFQNDPNNCYIKFSDSACNSSCWNSYYECAERTDFSACFDSIDTYNCEKLCCESESDECWYSDGGQGTGRMGCYGSDACKTRFSECRTPCQNTVSNCQGEKEMEICYDERDGCETMCCLSFDGCYATSDEYGNVECIDEPSNERSNMKCEDYVDTQSFADCISTDTCGNKGMSECIKSCCEEVSCYGYCSLNEVDRCKGQINCWDLITH